MINLSITTLLQLLPAADLQHALHPTACGASLPVKHASNAYSFQHALQAQLCCHCAMQINQELLVSISCQSVSWC